MCLKSTEEIIHFENYPIKMLSRKNTPDQFYWIKKANFRMMGWETSYRVLCFLQSFCYSTMAVLGTVIYSIPKQQRRGD